MLRCRSIKDASSNSHDDHSPPTSAPAGPSFDPMQVPVLHVSLEYSLPHLGFTNQMMYGGMGLVVDTFMQV